MPPLTPAPNTLYLASPALGPWFRTNDSAVSPPTLPLPAADLSVSITLAMEMEWCTPAIATRSYFIAEANRPSVLRNLRKENGDLAFTTGNLVVLLTIMPEAELRLWTLSQQIPFPDGSSLPVANTPTRPRVRYFALEIPAGSADTITEIENLRENDLPSDIVSEGDKAAYLGLTSSGSIGNAGAPIAELCKPAADSAVALKNRSGVPLAVNLWCFDYRGRALDPGAVANWWSYIASPGIWDNLWAHSETGEQRTAKVDSGKIVQICSAHEGPLSAELKLRLDLTDLTKIPTSSALYQTESAPAIALTTALDPDTAPIPRIAALPNGNYQEISAATPFAGWIDPAWPSDLKRDFQRLAFMDIEQHIIGLTRSNATQADESRRISPARNTADSAVLFTTDEVNQHFMNTLSSDTNAIAMAPVMDKLWGAVTPANIGNGDLQDTLNHTVHALAGEGTTSGGGSVEGQTILLHFEPGSLPENSWIRLWSHGLDTETGLHYRQDGGAAAVDTSGQAYVVLPIPDGVGSTTDSSVFLSFDALVVEEGGSRYYTEQRFARPVTVSGSRITLSAVPNVPANTSLWICEKGAVLNRGGSEYESGQTLLSIPDNLSAGQFALIDLTSLDATDISDNTLIKAVSSGDTLITTAPAFVATPEGELVSGDGPNSATLLHRDRNLLTNLDTMGRPVPSMERYEVAAIDRSSNTGVIGSTPGRAKNHEAPPSQLAHPGVPASAEIHGIGISLEGPAVDQLAPLMEERRAADLISFIQNIGAPAIPTADPGGTNTWTAILETMTHGVAGDITVRTLANTSFVPGKTWTELKTMIEDALSMNLDNQIDTSSFDDDALTAALDQVIMKTRDGAVQFATAVKAAIGRAEDFIYIETPAIDSQSANSDASPPSDIIDLIESIKTRWESRPGLCVLICVPEKFLPYQTKKMEEIRKSGVSAALKKLQDKAPDRVVLFSPTAGSGRRMHMASTTVIVDDALMLTGSTHLWRRGLTFDSSLAVGLFDENVAFGRPAAVRTARLQLVANALGLPTELVPEDAEDCLTAIQQMNDSGGLIRVKAGVYNAKPHTISSGDMDIWNPDGTPGIVSDWFVFLAALSGNAGTDMNNAIR